MELLHPLRGRQAAVEEHVQQAISSTTVELLDMAHQGQRPPFRVDIAREPRGISGQEYLQRVQEGTLTMLGATGLADSLEADDYIENIANTKVFHRQQQNLFTRRFHPSLTMVFRAKQPVR